VAQPDQLALAPFDDLEREVQQALEICGGDSIKALRVTLIANSFLEAQIDELKAQISSGFTRRPIKKRAATG